MKKTILITASSFPLSESDNKGNFIREYAENMSKFYDVHVITHCLHEAKKYERIKSYTVHRYSFLPFKALESKFNFGVLNAFSSSKVNLILLAPFYLISQLRAIVKLNKKIQADLIHAHWLIPQGLLAIIYRRIFNKNIKLITTSHGGDIFAFNNIIGRFLKKQVIVHSDSITVVSNHIKSYILDQGFIKRELSDKLSVLPMGLYTEKFNPGQRDKSVRTEYPFNNILLFVGRLTEKKGVRYIIEALPDILNKKPDTILIIAGDGVLRNELQLLVSNLNLVKNVSFLGNVDHTLLPRYYATADIFIGPSIVAKSGDSEGFGLVFAEACASQTPVITTDFGAMQDIIINGETGITVSQKSFQDITQAVLKLLEEKELRDYIRSNARAHIVENFDWKVISIKYSSLIQSLIR